MANQEGARRGMFGIGAPTRETATPVLPRPKTRPVPVSPEQGKLPKSPKKHIGRKARIALATLATLGAVETTGAVITEKTNNQPISTHTIPSDLAWPWNLGKSAAEDIRGLLQKTSSPVFDNTETKGKISSANILYVPREAFDKTPLADEEGAPIFDFPWDNNNPTVEIKYNKSLWPEPDWWKSGVDPKTEIKNNFDATSTLPAGFEFPALYPGRVFFADSPYNREKIDMVKMEFLAPNGIQYFVNIGIQTGNETVRLEPLIDVVLQSPDNGYGRDWEKGVLVERGQKIFRLKEKGKLHMYIEGGKVGSLLQKDQIPGNFQFQTQKDSNGVEKLLVSETPLH